MNFLQLVQRLHRRTSSSGAAPVTLVNQIEDIQRKIDWVNEAWMEIQEERNNWNWMRNAMSFPTVSGQPNYTLAQIQATGTNFSNFGAWDEDTFRSYQTSVGTNTEIQMPSMPYENWRDVYQFGGMRNTRSRPFEFTVMPDAGIGLGPTPEVGYTITGEYFKAALEMSADTDIPSLPTQFHMAIVYKAMMFYGVSEAALEVYEEGKGLYDKMMRRLEWNQLPSMQFPGALA
jgi:hypothetical protein